MAAAQFLLLALPDGLKIGGTVRVMAAAVTAEDAKDRLENLDPSVLGRIAVVEISQVFERRPAVQNLPSTTPLLDIER